MHHYDKQRSPESWSSSLTPLLAENNRGACALRHALNALKDTVNTPFKRHETCPMFSAFLMYRY